MSKNLLVMATLIVLGACNNPTPAKSTTAADDAPLSSARETVKAEPVGLYEKKLSDKLKNEATFTVKLFETPYRFKFAAQMQYGSLKGADTITFPNFGKEPVPVIQGGATDAECIIGFMENDAFKQLKKIEVDETGSIRSTILKKYAVAKEAAAN